MKSGDKVLSCHCESVSGTVVAVDGERALVEFVPYGHRRAMRLWFDCPWRDWRTESSALAQAREREEGRLVGGEAGR